MKKLSLSLLVSFLILLFIPLNVNAGLKAGTTGEDVVKYAKQFVGNPYVHGGTSLTNGCDCSGFVMKVYENFGMNFSHSSSAFATASGTTKVDGITTTKNGNSTVVTEESYKYMQPGDIVVWNGHVGIYCGNGEMVHAQSKNTGIVVSKKLSSGHDFLAVVRVDGITSDGSSTTSTGGSDGSWCKVRINQTGVGHGSGCTTVTLQLILQNSRALKSEYQLDGDITSANDAYKKFDDATTDFHSGDSWILGGFADGATKLSDDATWTHVSSISGQDLSTADYNSVKAIVGLGNKDFKDMSYEEQVTAMKAIWNSGYYAAFCVEYKGVGQESNGPSGYKAAHATMLAGVTDTDIYINDPANGQVCLYKDRSAKGGAYNLMYIVLFKNDKYTPNSISSGGNASVTQVDETNAQNLGVSSDLIRGYYSEDQLSSYLRLNEVNIAEMFLDNAKRENLSQDNLTGLTNWERNVNNDKKEHGFIRFLRTLTMLLGIILVLYSMFLYIAYWFDKINTLFAFEMLSLLTFGKLHIAGDEDSSSFNLTKEGTKTVNHKNIIFICLTSLFFGMLLITGAFYRIISAFVNFVLRLLN